MGSKRKTKVKQVFHLLARKQILNSWKHKQEEDSEGLRTENKITQNEPETVLFSLWNVFRNERGGHCGYRKNNM
jgi:hypothetical protein